MMRSDGTRLNIRSFVTGVTALIAWALAAWRASGGSAKRAGKRRGLASRPIETAMQCRLPSGIDPAVLRQRQTIVLSRALMHVTGRGTS
jgi:hypothetical protein